MHDCPAFAVCFHVAPCCAMRARTPSHSTRRYAHSGSTAAPSLTRPGRQRGLRNLTVLTADMVNFQAPGTYDRIVSGAALLH